MRKWQSAILLLLLGAVVFEIRRKEEVAEVSNRARSDLEDGIQVQTRRRVADFHSYGELVDSVRQRKPSVALLYGPDSSRRLQSHFQKLGELEGERALDDIFDEYGHNPSLASLAMFHAILGWMETDRDVAIDALQKLLIHDTPAFGNLMSWKGRQFLSALG